MKNMINRNVLKKLSEEIVHVHPGFDSGKLTKLELDGFELKARVLLITKKLKELLPGSFPESIKIIHKTIERDNLKGFELWPFSEYIGQFGLDHFDESLKTMYLLTQKFTSEFAIRPFLLKDHGKVMKQFRRWARDKNLHVRRWVSEGTRPLLPWGVRLPIFVLDPTPNLLLLDMLKFDEELYVRKSVANHLNDISKNHPSVVINILKIWEKDCPQGHLEKLNWIKRQALRTLIKKGHMGALALMGIEGKAKVNLEGPKLTRKVYKLGEKLEFNLILTSTSTRRQKIVIDYGIDFIKANGTKSAKVFKLKTLELGPGEVLHLKKSHSLKPITTMTYYEGLHHLIIQVNGEKLSKTNWTLRLN